MQVDKVGVVAIQLPKLVSFETCGVNIVVGVHMLVRDDVLGLAEFVSGGSDIVHGQVSVSFSLIDGEVEVLLGDYFFVGRVGKGFFVKLVLEVL